MNRINLKGVTSEAITGILVLLVALINATLQMLGINVLPIEDAEIFAIVSTLFLVLTTLWNTWKNRNLSSARQIAQNITDAIKNGELLEKDVKELLNKINR